MRVFNAGPPGGRYLPPTKIRLADLRGGPYGAGASASVRHVSPGGAQPQTQLEWHDLLEFYVFHAERGNPTFMYRLGRLHYNGFGGDGAGGARGGNARLGVGLNDIDDGLAEGGRDFVSAFRWLRLVARAVWPRDPREATTMPGMLAAGAARNAHQRASSPHKPATPPPAAPPVGYYDPNKDPRAKVDDHTQVAASLAAGILGRMFLRGEAVKTDYAKAFLWFSRGISLVRLSRQASNLSDTR